MNQEYLNLSNIIILAIYIAIYTLIIRNAKSKICTSDRKSTVVNGISRYLLSICFITGLVFMIWLFVWTIYKRINNTSMTSLTCYTDFAGSSTFMSIFKYIIYLTLLNKVYGSYKGGIMAYNNLFFIVIGSIFTLWAILNIVLLYIRLDITINEIGICEFNHSLLAIVYTSIMFNEIVAIIITSYLFAKPICRLNKFNKDIKSLIIRHLILSSITNFTTIFLIAISFWQSIYFGQVLVGETQYATDVVVSSVCVLWMSVQYEKFVDYKILKCCLRLAIGSDFKSIDPKTADKYDEECHTISGNVIALVKISRKSETTTTSGVKIDSSTKSVTSTNITAKINKTDFPPFALDVKYVSDSEKIYVILMKLKLIVSYDNFAQIISQYAATIYKSCVECGTQYPCIECYEDCFISDNVLTNCDPITDKIRYYLMCVPEYSRIIENHIDHYDEEMEILCVKCGVKTKCSVCSTQFLNHMLEEALILNGCDLCKRTICEDCALFYKNQVICEFCRPESAVEGSVVSYKSIKNSYKSVKSKSTNNNASQWGSFGF